MDDFGDRMKMYEGIEAKRKLNPYTPIIIRVDGKGFSKFTKGFVKPFDPRLSGAMNATCKTLVEETGAIIGYVQSDEITLVLKPIEEGQSAFLGARTSKLDSLSASLATSAFIRSLSRVMPLDAFIDKLPRFDGRSWNVPDRAEATNAVLWRVHDARKNGISCAYRWTVGHNKKGMNGREMVETIGDYETRFSEYERLGAFHKPVYKEFELPDHVWDNIPDERKPESRIVNRKEIAVIGPSEFLSMDFNQRKEFIFD